MPKNTMGPANYCLKHISSVSSSLLCQAQYCVHTSFLYPCSTFSCQHAVVLSYCTRHSPLFNICFFRKKLNQNERGIMQRMTPVATQMKTDRRTRDEESQTGGVGPRCIHIMCNISLFQIISLKGRLRYCCNVVSIVVCVNVVYYTSSV